MLPAVHRRFATRHKARTSAINQSAGYRFAVSPAIIAAFISAAVAFSMPLPFTHSHGVASAHTFVAMSLDFLAKKSTRVVVGVPLEANSLWEETAAGRRIATYHRVRVETSIVGEGPREIWVRRMGGTVDGVGQVVFGEAVLRANEPVLLFLVAREDRTFSVLGMEQGCFPVDPPKERTAKRGAANTGNYLIGRRQSTREPLPPSTPSRESVPVPASVLEGLSVNEAKRIILEARSRNVR